MNSFLPEILQNFFYNSCSPLQSKKPFITKRKRKNKKSFTLVEILIVVGIISILSALVISAINPLQLRRVARDSNRKKDMQIIASALEQYYADNNRYPPGETLAGDFELAELKELLEGTAVSGSPIYLRTVSDRQPIEATTSQYCYLVQENVFQEYLLCSPMEADMTVLPNNYLTDDQQEIISNYCSTQFSLPDGSNVTNFQCITNPF